jgi:hypothetical protein
MEIIHLKNLEKQQKKQINQFNKKNLDLIIEQQISYFQKIFWKILIMKIIQEL